MKKNIIKPTLFTLDQMVQNYESEMDIDLPNKTNFRNVLLNEKDFNNLFGIKNADGSKNLTRYSLPDFYYDLVKHISPIETKLVKSGKLNLEHYLYQQVQKKALVPELQNELNTYTSLIYAQNNTTSHWNKTHLIPKEKIDEIIFNECLSKGIDSFNILTKIFSPDQFLNSISNEEKSKSEHFSLNLQESLFLNIIYKDIDHSQPLIDVFHILQNLGSKINYQKLEYLSSINYKKINFESLMALNEKKFEDTSLSEQFTSSNNIPYTVKNFVYLNCEKNKFKMVVKKKDFNILKDCKNKLIEAHTWSEVKHLFLNDLQATIKSDIKNFFSKFSSNLHYYTLTHIEDDKINQLTLPELFKQANGKDYSLLEFSHDYFVSQSLFDMFTKGESKILDGKTYHTLSDIKDYLLDKNLVGNIESLINHRRDNTLDKEIKIQWSMLSIEVKAATLYNKQENKKNKI